MNRALREALGPPAEYADLPVAIREQYTPHEWLWMADSTKAQLLQRDTEPEWDEP